MVGVARVALISICSVDRDGVRCILGLRRGRSRCRRGSVVDL
jgi:hypothetical protein